MTRTSIVRGFFDWLNARVESRSSVSLSRIIGRFSRGNVTLQRGRFLTSAQASRIVAIGDRAIKRLDRLAAKR